MQKRIRFAVAAALLLSIGAVAQPPEPRKDPPPVANPVILEDATPESAIASFVEALNNDDLAAAAHRVIGGQTGKALEEISQQWQTTHGTWRIMVRDVDAQKIEDGFVTTKLRLRLLDRWGNKITHDERLNLQLVDKVWKILPLLPDSFRRTVGDDSDSDMLANLAAYLTLPPLSAEKRTEKCLMNLKFLALGLIELTQDWDDIFAIKADKFQGALLPYTRSTMNFYCPHDKSGAISYAFNANLENVLVNRVAEPAHIVMIYEGKNGQLEFRHDNRAGVAFADGHCKLVTPEEAKTLRWKP